MLSVQFCGTIWLLALTLMTQGTTSEEMDSPAIIFSSLLAAIIPVFIPSWEREVILMPPSSLK